MEKIIKIIFLLIICFLVSGCIEQNIMPESSLNIESESNLGIVSKSNPDMMPESNPNIESESNPDIMSESNPNIKSVSLLTDKDVYYSNELMNITVIIDSENIIENVDVRVYGINARRNRLDKTEKVGIKEGLNTVNFLYKTPSCYGCAGISPGIYKINAEVKYDNKTINKIKEVEIRK